MEHFTSSPIKFMVPQESSDWQVRAIVALALAVIRSPGKFRKSSGQASRININFDQLNDVTQLIRIKYRGRPTG